MNEIRDVFVELMNKLNISRRGKRSKKKVIDNLIQNLSISEKGLDTADRPAHYEYVKRRSTSQGKETRQKYSPCKYTPQRKKFD